MPDLLIELFSEEIPARMQRKAAGDLRKLVTDALVNAGLTYEGAKEYWTPRRLVLDVRGVTARSAGVTEEKKGPRTDAPAQAVQGFLRGAGLDSIDQAQIRSDPKKGDFYVAVIAKPGRDAKDIIAGALPPIIREFPWPKSMRWGEASRQPGSLRWVRPLQSILCTFGPETEEPEVIPFEVDGMIAGNITRGHRFLSPGAFAVKRFDDYAAGLEAAHVILDPERRKRMILADAGNLAFAQGFELVADEGLAEETANLTEWPVVLMGEFDEAFLDIPAEIVRLTIRANQKCFVMHRPLSPLAGEMSPQVTEGGISSVPKTPSSVGPFDKLRTDISPARGESKRLANRFLLVSNIAASDGGREIARGNGKVVRARLSDAKFFWDGDLAIAKSKDGFGKWIANLDHVTFHAKLGSQGERVKRIMALAKELAPIVGADPDMAARAAHLAKADLQSATVFEFPEVQGKMGRRYAEAAGEDASVARAIEEHYKPLGPTDDVPTDPVSVAVALADKLDTLVGFWAIDEKPTGSKDPYALRRAALGVIRLVVENGVRLNLTNILGRAYSSQFERFQELNALCFRSSTGSFRTYPHGLQTKDYAEQNARWWINTKNLRRNWTHHIAEHAAEIFDESIYVRFHEEHRTIPDLLSFLHERLKVFLRDEGVRHDVIDAVLSSPLSPLAGEMSAKPTEGGKGSTLGSPPSALLSDSRRTGISPARGESGSVAANDDLLLIVLKARALQKLIDTEDGKNLLAGYKRAANILAAEEKKGAAVPAEVQPGLLKLESELQLANALNQASKAASQAIEKEDFSGAMQALAQLRGPIDSFFEKVLVNDPDNSVRLNRLALLARIRAATATVADFSKIAG